MVMDRKPVRVTASREPQFLIEHEGKIYLTVTVLEYDPHDTTIDAEQQQQADDLQATLDEGPFVKACAIGGRENTEMAFMALEIAVTKKDN